MCIYIYIYVPHVYVGSVCSPINVIIQIYVQLDIYICTYSTRMYFCKHVPDFIVERETERQRDALHNCGG